VEVGASGGGGTPQTGVALPSPGHSYTHGITSGAKEFGALESSALSEAMRLAARKRIVGAQGLCQLAASSRGVERCWKS